jgi:hypothetical protein
MFDVVLLETYQKAREIVSAFAKPDGLTFVIIVGKPGLGKTNTFYKEISPGCVLFQGGLTPVKFYCELYRHRNKPVVLDDCDEVFDTRAGINLLKCVGQTDKIKTLMWEKASPVLLETRVPNRFETQSHILLFANTLRSVQENLGAVLDRAHLYRFAPSSWEVHREVGTWFKDGEIYEFIGSHLAQIESPSMRDYVKADELKRVGLEWREPLLQRWYRDPKLAATLRLTRDEKLSPAERQSEFTKLGFGAEATYKRYLAKANKLTRPTQMSEAQPAAGAA